MEAKIRRLAWLFPVVLSVAAGQLVAAMPDPGFHAGQAVRSLPDGLLATGRAVLVQPDGKLVVAGNTRTGCNDAEADFLLLRYHADGSPDTGFGNGGVVVSGLGPSRDIAYAVLQQADGKLLAIGGSEGGGAQGSIAVARYLPDGSPDRSFNGNGVAITTLNIGNVAAFAGAVQADGKILAAGHDNAHGFAVVRYLPDGSLDTAFGKGGVVVIKAATRGWAKALAVQGDGRIVLAGHANDGAQLRLFRLLPDGSLDQGFGQGGRVDTETGERRTGASSVLALADGSLLVAGTTRLGPDQPQQMLVLRYRADGSLDERFGTGGAVVVPSAEPTLATALLAQPGGELMVTGYQRMANDRAQPVLATLGPQGEVTGRTVLDMDGELAAAAFQPDGKLVIAVSQPEGKAWVQRLLP